MKRKQYISYCPSCKKDTGTFNLRKTRLSDGKKAINGTCIVCKQGKNAYAANKTEVSEIKKKKKKQKRTSKVNKDK